MRNRHEPYYEDVNGGCIDAYRYGKRVLVEAECKGYDVGAGVVFESREEWQEFARNVERLFDE